MKPWPKSLMLKGQTVEQDRIMQWVAHNVDCAKTLSLTYLDRNHMRLTDIYYNHYLLTCHSDGSVTMQEILEAC